MRGSKFFRLRVKRIRPRLLRPILIDWLPAFPIDRFREV